MPSVLITGSSRGIGRATALELARAGHTVLATMRRPQCSDLASQAGREGLALHVAAMDVDSDASVARTIAALVEEHGVPDVLVNNAGIERRGATEELPLDAFRKVMETNYFGALRCIQALLPGMRSRGSGIIVNVGSVAARMANAPLHPYAASKSALDVLSQALGQELAAHGIRVVMVEPGIIDTHMARQMAVEPPPSRYPNGRRFSRMFAAVLRHAPGPEAVAARIACIIGGDDHTFRHTVGPSADPSLLWRSSLSDEAWRDWWGVAEDAEWYEQVARDFGVDLRPGS